MSRPAAALLLLVCAWAGCVNRVADHCAGCLVIKEAQRTTTTILRSDARALVVLVPGAFGFGSEWDPIVAALEASPDLPFVVFEWRGPFHDLTGAVSDLSRALQQALDASPRLTEVLILAHSAGGPLATRAALELTVPNGRRVRLASIDSPAFIDGRPFFRDKIGADPIMPAGVERTVYLAEPPPKNAAAGAQRVYLGKSVSHNRAVALVGLPLIAELAASVFGAVAHADGKPSAVGTLAHAGEAEGLAVDVMVQGPAAQRTPLQVACVFEYVEGDIFTPPALPAEVNGMVHLDQSLHGLVTELRKSGAFAGHSLETLLITPPKGTIAAERLLLIGLGDRRQFSTEIMKRVGAVGMREALRLGVTAYSHASDLKDAGVDSPTRGVAEAVIAGALDALRTERHLAGQSAAPSPSVRSLTLLAGPAFFADTAAAARELLATKSRSGSFIR